MITPANESNRSILRHNEGVIPKEPRRRSVRGVYYAMISPFPAVRSLSRLNLSLVCPLLLCGLLTTAPAAHAQKNKGQKSSKPQSGKTVNQKGLDLSNIGKTPEEPSKTDIPEKFYAHSYAIIIGISHYKDATKNLEYAAADADALAQILEDSYDFPKGNVTILTNEKATRVAIENALSEIKNKKKFTAHTRVVVFFSGHGQTVKDKSGIDKGFLIPYDADVKFEDLQNEEAYLKTCIRMDTLWGYLTNTNVNLHALLIADACYGGLLTDSKRGFGGEDPDRPSDPVVADLLSQNALEVLTAGGKDQPVIENSAWGHGAFTFKLLGVLKKRAETPNDIFLASQLATFLQTSVGGLTKGRQRPQFGKRDSEGDVVFYTSGASLANKPANVASVTSHPATGSSNQGNALAGSAIDYSELAGKEVRVKPEEDWDPHELQAGAEIRGLLMDDLQDSTGKVVIPAKTTVVGHVIESYYGVVGGKVMQGLVHGHEDYIKINCDYILTPYKKIPLRKDNKHLGSPYHLLPKSPRHIYKAKNTQFKLHISENPNSTDDEASATKDE